MKTILHDKEAADKLEHLRKNNLIILECIVGSQAYGTALPDSDEDKKFIYIEPLENILSNTATEQLNVNKDYVGYEIGRFCELIASGNPNMLDLLNMPEDCIISMSPLFKTYFIDNMHMFLTKAVETSFGEYAKTQISKATGANKKQMSPMEKERKGLLDFCWVSDGQKSVPLKSFLDLRYTVIHGYSAFGVAGLDHMKNCYNLFIDEIYQDEYTVWLNKGNFSAKEIPTEISFYAHRKYKGITDKDDVQIVLSSIDKFSEPLCTFYCNLEGFQKYCKDYKAYWDWFEVKNPVRYLHNITVGEGYDTKNMAHCHRLLDMCIEILKDGQLNIRRANRQELLDIRAGKTKYEKLLKDANDKIALIKELAQASTLPDSVPKEFISNLLFEIRKKAYNLSFSSPQL
jgi:predicted nucleotidyltransferase